MNRLTHPKRLGVHRNAAIALYRALLGKVIQLSLRDHTAGALANLIRRKFRAHQNVWSKRRLELAFHNGYEALDILDSAALGDRASLTRIRNLLYQLPEDQKAPLPAPPKPEPKPATPKTPTHPKGSIFDRPHASISGRRHVPHFVLSSSGVAFLRYKKPQPLALSMYIRDHAIKLDKWHTRLHDLQERVVEIAAAEDVWDRILEEEFRDGNGEALMPLDYKELSWRGCIEEFGIRALIEMINADMAKQKARGHETLKVWEREIELDKKEREERERSDTLHSQEHGE